MARISLSEFSRLFFSGLLDSICLGRALCLLLRQSNLRWLYCQVVMLNGLLSIGSLLLFERILHPLFSYYHRIGSLLPWLLYYALWVWPLFLLAYLLNSLYYAQMSAILNARDRNGSLTFRISSFLYQLSILLFSFHLYTLLYYLPWIGLPLSFVGLSSLVSHSAYTCTRLHMASQFYTQIECHWPYYVGFGALLASLSYLPSMSIVLSASVYGLLFPLLLTLAAVQKQPDLQGTRQDAVPHGAASALWHAAILPKRLPIFAIGRYMTHLFIRKLRARAGK